MVTKPAPLWAIVKAEGPRDFARLSEKYSNASKLRGLLDSQPKSSKPALTDQLVQRMRAMDVSLTPRKDVLPSGKLQDQMADSTPDRLSEVDVLAHSVASVVPIDITIEDDVKSSPARPLSKHLVAKRSYACFSCQTPLMAPVAAPTLMKILRRQYAVDVVPTVEARAVGPWGLETPCELIVTNPLSGSVSITVAIVASLPKSFKHGPDAVALPTSHFSVQGRRENTTLLQLVPSAYVTGATQQGRGVQLERARERVQRAEETGPSVEVGPNWVSVPFSISVEEREPGSAAPKVDVPFYITGEARVREGWRTERRGLKFGFWAVCRVIGT